MADPVTGIVNCLEVPSPEIPLAGLKNLVGALILTLPDIIAQAPALAVKGPKLPQAIVELFIGNLSPGLPSISAKIDLPGGLGKIHLDVPGADVPGFDPSGLIKFAIGLITIGVGVPTLFFDIDKKKPKIPTQKLVVDLVSKNLAIPDPPVITAEFKLKFTKCCVEGIKGVILP